eukprot:2907751-Pyramimonas_sp.AAC.1
MERTLECRKLENVLKQQVRLDRVRSAAQNSWGNSHQSHVNRHNSHREWQVVRTSSALMAGSGEDTSAGGAPGDSADDHPRWMSAPDPLRTPSGPPPDPCRPFLAVAEEPTARARTGVVQ